MKIGFLGLPGSGKTTIFNALTGSDVSVGGYGSTKAEPNLAVVTVGDERVDRLAEMYLPKKIIHATIECVDFVGFSEGSARNGGFSASQMALVKTMDALALVLRNFPDDIEGEPDPLRDLDALETELLLTDLIMVEQRLERITHTIERGKKTPELQAEQTILVRLQEWLNENRSLRDMDFSDEENRIIVNSSETNFGKNDALIRALEQRFRVIEFAGAFEMELCRLSDEEEAKLFMDDMGISESARSRLTRFAYETLGYISFLTVGSDEVRAWTLRRGETALDAAGTIHSDLARGFIRAECFSYDDFIACGSEKAVKEQGKFRLEGKDYVVHDGDILNIRFSV